MKQIFLLLILSLLTTSSYSLQPAITTPIPLAELVDYQSASPSMKNMMEKAVALSQQKLTYLYGSANPDNGGMDCSGTIYYLLSQSGVKSVPRSSDAQFSWVQKNGKLYLAQKPTAVAQLTNLKFGDLLFWSGTYAKKTHAEITHVMIYLGKNSNGDALMFGASDGRTYQGKKMWGVSVFDFNLPNNKGPQRFVGYSCIPTLSC